MVLFQRFSEDLDFKVKLPPTKITRNQRSHYRQQIIEAVHSSGVEWTLHETDILVGNQSQFFSCNLAYQSAFGIVEALRPHLRLEMMFSSPALPYEKRSLSSFVAQFKQEPPEVPSIACVSPIETAADKLSALVWRVLSRQRGSGVDDPKLFAKDAKRTKTAGKIERRGILESITDVIRILESDLEYAVEYERFVIGMSYAPEENTPTFEQVILVLQRFAESVS